MENFYQATTYKIIDIRKETPIIKRFRLLPENGEVLKYEPGQIVFVSIPGFGEAPFAPCGDSGADYLELCVRRAGRVTDKIHSMETGDSVGIRGPYGRGWITSLGQEKKKNLHIVVGGLGMIPVRTLILGKDKYLGSDATIQLFYGARHPSEFLFKDDYENWKDNGVDLQLTIDKACPEWDGCVGLVTTLFDKHNIIEDCGALLVGPPIMYKFVLQQLEKKNFPESDIYMSLERRMHCGVGVCQHCAIGSHYTCKDGPVFKYEEIKNVVRAL